MDNVMEIITNVTGFITYFAPGFIFLSCYNYVAYLQRESKSEYLFIKSISISYVFYIVSSLIGDGLYLSLVVTQALAFALAIVFGLVFGRLHRAKWANCVFRFLFKREIDNNLFVELMKNAEDNNFVVGVTLTMKDGLGIYEGQIEKIFSYNHAPDLLLIYYKCYDCNYNIILDFANVDNAGLLVHYSDIEKFEYELLDITT